MDRLTVKGGQGEVRRGLSDGYRALLAAHQADRYQA
jgi:hypothetical protein